MKPAGEAINAGRGRKGLRVLAFFTYFFGFAIGLPALTGALIDWRYDAMDHSPWQVRDGRFVNGHRLLGAAEPVIDMRPMFPFAEAAALAAGRDGTIALAVRAGSAADIERVVRSIERRYRLAVPPGAAARIGGEGGWQGRLARDECHLAVLLGPERGLVERRFAGIAPWPAAEASGDGSKQLAVLGIFGWAALQFFLFGRVASWASGEPAAPGVAPLPAEALIGRLLALNGADAPYSVSRGGRDDEIVVDWRYADAKWLDLMRAHGMRKVYRLVLRLDAGAAKVRAQDSYASFDWSAGGGPSAAELEWTASRGISFFDARQERVFGLQLRDGKPSYAYKFDLNELKQPVIDIVRSAGWSFRPVVTFFRPIGG